MYETDINYYVRLNFSSLIEIVDILGGVDVYSEYAFTTGWESGYEMEVQQGINHFDGNKRLLSAGNGMHWKAETIKEVRTNRLL